MKDYQILLNKYQKLVKQYQEKFENKFAEKDLFEYNEILFSAHSCAIENNSFTVNETRELKEHGLSLKLQNKSLKEAFEILDHFKAFEYLFSDLTQPLSESLLINTQNLLTQNTVRYYTGYEPGVYSNTQMAAGDTIFGDPEMSKQSVPVLMQQTQEALDKNIGTPIEISAKFHLYFIYLHPFPDGNGRTGRLISSYILAKKNEPLIIIPGDKKNEYIEALKASNKHQDATPICCFFMETSINRMENELQQLNNNIPNTKENKNSKGLSFIF
ncbi:MAG: Fic family protein [Chitinophagaceae bacterium]|jgi:Fic family protein|nr:Fic family protein [Chitinophagaceae bacterium]